ncbi:MAG: hypothetical protein R3C97_00530 [Geminicoccaceae bacterium]
MRITVSFESLSEADALDPGDAFWLADTPENKAIAKRIWMSGETDPGSALFKRVPTASAGEELLEILADIDLHHSDWSEIRFLGKMFARDHVDVLRRCGFRAELKDRELVVLRQEAQ